MEQLLELLRELHPEVDFQTETGLLSGRILDSFDVVTLISGIRERFGVRIPASDIRPEHFDRPADIYALIERRRS